jgi:hypothetical protein
MAGISSQAHTEPSAISHAEHGAPHVLVHHSEHCWVTPKYEHELPSALIHLADLTVLMAGVSSQAQTLPEPDSHDEHGAPQFSVHQTEHSWVSPK